MIKREEYLQKLLAWKDEQVIKVVTGIRRCGKSTLLDQYRQLLTSQGVQDSQIISINFEELENESLLDYKILYSHLKSRLKPKMMTYVFLDEIQKVSSFEKAVDSLYVRPNVDIYLTGSNAYMLSGDLATYLSGRYIEIPMLPLSFKEFSLTVEGTVEEKFALYMKDGGLPYITQMDKTEEKVQFYLEGIYNTVIVKDIEDRIIRKDTNTDTRKVIDLVLLKSISKYLSSVIGSPVSIKGITNYLISSGRKVSPNTVDDYVKFLFESFLFYPAERFDVVGKQLLKTNKKIYMVDLGLRNLILPRSQYDLGFSLENVVFFELLRRGNTVFVGKNSDMEIDFIARKNNETVYYQITANMTSEKTFEREMKPLRALKDNYRKIVLTLDRLSIGNYSGIEVINALDWLLS